MTVVKRAVSFKKPIHDELQTYRAKYITETKQNISFSAAMNEVLEAGFKAKGRWTKNE